MEVVQITSFKDYLIKKKYSLKTVRMYAECLKCLDEGIPNDKDELFIYLCTTKLKQKKVLSKPKFNNFRAAIHLLFTMTTGLTVKEYLKATYIQDCNFKETFFLCRISSYSFLKLVVLLTILSSHKYMI